MKLARLFHALPTACRKFSQSACVGERRYRPLAVADEQDVARLKVADDGDVLLVGVHGRAEKRLPTWTITHS